jgi:hypothetical protein
MQQFQGINLKNIKMNKVIIRFEINKKVTNFTGESKSVELESCFITGYFANMVSIEFETLKNCEKAKRILLKEGISTYKIRMFKKHKRLVLFINDSIARTPNKSNDRRKEIDEIKLKSSIYAVYNDSF